MLTDAPGYNAESTISRDGKKIVFTSTRNGDLDIYTMNADGTDVKQLTHELGYDGGPFWSADGKKIVYRAEHPKTPQEIADYKALYAQGLIRPGNLEIWVMDADGRHKHQVTHNGAANFAPFFHPDGKRIIFASNWPIQEWTRLRSLHDQRRWHAGCSVLRTIPISTRFPCLRQMASGWCGPRTATAKCRTRRIFSLRTGWSEKGRCSLFTLRPLPTVIPSAAEGLRFACGATQARFGIEG